MAFIAFLFRKEKNSSKPEIPGFILHRVNGLALIMLWNRRGYFEIVSVLFEFICDFRGARFFEPEFRRVGRGDLSTNSVWMCFLNQLENGKKMFSFHCLTHSETWNIFVLEGCDSSNCACELGFFHFSVSFTHQGTRVFVKRALEFYFV